MKKLYFYFLIIILSSILVYGISEEQTITAEVTVNSVSGVLNVSPASLSVNAPPLSFLEKNLIFSQELGNIDLNVSLFLEISEINSWISFSENNFTVKPNEIKDIITHINIPNTIIGNYSGNIHAITNSQDLIIPVNIAVTDKYKVDVNIDVTQSKIKAGENISVFTELIKIKEKKEDPEVEGKISIELVYNVMKGKEVITNLTTIIDVIDSKTDTILILIPINATKGGYAVEVTATHLDKIAKDKDNFLVKTKLLRRFFNFFRRFR